jgi:hypothetical protein
MSHRAGRQHEEAMDHILVSIVGWLLFLWLCYAAFIA